MRDRLLISAGLALFVALVTMPFWSRQLAARDLVQVPALQLPANEKECVAPAAFMRASHMQLLVSWREDAVRHGNRQFIGANGKVYEKNLTHTCLGCHNKQEFCDRCHAYAGVSSPNCWNCHSEPQTTLSVAIPASINSNSVKPLRIEALHLPASRRSAP